ncbi:lysylphosphatidylglycerol synthase transmembrane domain-containing protein [Bryobacter aggregatus]|uniref:lysylphosphatidylglycerol synthase transmembrane domain-containing protein n=1 Tax=Bryobacter aggregatus TaxID=360054 RepID=UPI0004E1D0CB|nr:lysylphosphatidylglycerol synthase transmembrane domain-containing protein [Bryobacter aggregatus]
MERIKLSWQSILLLVLTNLASLGILFWVLQDVHLSELWPEIQQMQWGWVAIAAVTDILVYVIQGWRWSILLRPVSRIPVMRSVRAIYVGLYANEVLPFRSGEIIRSYLQSRWGHLPFSVVLSSIAIERIFDGIWLVLYLSIVVQFVDLPRRIRDGGYVLILVVGLLAAALAFIIAFQTKAKELAKHWRWGDKARIFVDDLQAMGASRSFFLSWLASLPHLLLMAVPIYCVMRAYGLTGFTLWDAAVVNVIVRLGTIVPGAPGNLGVYQGLIVFALMFFGIDADVAKRFSLIVWAIVTLPLLIAGVVALSVTGFNLRELQKTATAVKADEHLK